MGLFAYGLLACLLSLIAFRSRSRTILLLLQALPIVFLFTFLWLTRGQYDILQVRKIGYEFEKVGEDLQHPGRTIFIGGDQQKDDIFSENLPNHAIRVTPSLTDSSFEIENVANGVLIFRNNDPMNIVY